MRIKSLEKEHSRIFGYRQIMQMQKNVAENILHDIEL